MTQHCGRTQPHPTHKAMRGRRAFQCTGTPAVQPRHTADSITDDALTALYDERDELRALLHDAEGDRDSWARDARRAEQQAEADARKAYTDLIDEQKRAGRAEDALNAVRTALHSIHLEVGRHRGTGDPETLGYRLGLAEAERQLRAALDAHTTPTETT